MRKISATYIFSGNQPPLKRSILVCEDDGTVAELIDTGGELFETAGLEYYNGILVPGFVNAHCHLELSHLKDKIPEKSGLPGFLHEINKLRNRKDVFDENASEKADLQMQQAGIVAVGDVANSGETLETKQHSSLYYHTFAEAFGFHPSRAEKAFQLAEQVEEMFHAAGLEASVTPHSGYSVSDLLFQKIKKKAQSTGGILSIHNQESLVEEEFFKFGSGPIFHHLHHNLGLDISHWKRHEGNMAELILPFLPKRNHLLLVHNTFTTMATISAIKKYRDLNNTFFVLCPNSNLYIEDQLPPLPLFQKENINLCLGTDSLASNHQLSILQEMITLHQHFPYIRLEDLVNWACLNGARALNIEKRLGSFEKGKNPGINLITGADLQQLKLTPASRVKVLQLPA